MNILAIDTSSSSCSLSIAKDSKIVASVSLNCGKQHSTALMPLLSEMMEKSKMKAKDIDAFAVNAGPGSFTGIRIGMAVIKAMNLATGKKIYSYDSFKILAEKVKYTNLDILVVIDALRNTYYSEILRFDGENFITIEKSEVREANEIVELCRKHNNLLVIGDGAEKLKGRMENTSNVTFGDESTSLPDASSLITLTLREINSNVIRESYDENPVYMRKSQAEREYDLKMGIK